MRFLSPLGGSPGISNRKTIPLEQVKGGLKLFFLLVEPWEALLENCYKSFEALPVQQYTMLAVSLAAACAPLKSSKRQSRPKSVQTILALPVKLMHTHLAREEKDGQV